MLYYQVKKEADQKQASVRFKYSFLIGSELYTAREIEKAMEKGWITESFIIANFNKVNVAPKSTYFVFGARKTESIK